MLKWVLLFTLAATTAWANGGPYPYNRVEAQGSVPEVVEDGVTGIVVDSVEEAAGRLEEALRLDRAAIRHRFEQRFSSERMARDTLDLYRVASSSRSSKESS